MDLLITAERLVCDQKNNKILLVDARPYIEYSKGHIPGAVNLDLFQFHWTDTTEIGIRQFDRQSRILLSNIGISDENCVVFYDNISGMSAARGVWLLIYFSHKNVFLLDGGFECWRKKGYPSETKTNGPTVSKFLGKPNPSVLATAGEIRKSLKKMKLKLIDTRSEGEYNGSYMRAARAGHIPNAINIDWKDNIRDGIFKTTEELSNIYSGIPKNSRVVTYCQGGYRAANSFIALKLLGYKNVKIYLGSWGEWGNKVNLPVEQ